MLNKIKSWIRGKWTQLFLKKNKKLRFILTIITIISLAISFILLCLDILRPEALDVAWTYFLLLWILLSLVLFRLAINTFLVQRAREPDLGLVNYYLAQALFLEPTVINEVVDEPPHRPTNYNIKFDNLKKLRNELKKQVDEKSELREWDILSLQAGLVDFTDAHQLIGDARLLLNELEDYAKDSTYSMDRENFDEQRREVLSSIDLVTAAISTSKILRAQNKDKEGFNPEIYIDDEAERLRAAIRSLQEYITDYLETWAKGSVALSGLKFCCAVGIVIFLTAGLLPLCTQENICGDKLNWFNWSFIATSGALTSVLFTFLHSNETEIGNTQSRAEVSRAIIAMVLGFTSGAIFYSIVGGQLTGKFIDSDILPNFEKYALKDMWLSVFWAFASGFLFEKFINKAKTSI